MGIMLKSIFVVLIALLALAGITYYLALGSKADLDDTARNAAPGHFVQLTDGKVHYRWFGPEDGSVIVMAHGFSTPNFIFEQNAEALAAEGFRVLTFDHFGRGWSDRPKGTYSIDFYDRELVELTERLDLNQPFGLVGLSMGGVIVAEFAARHPERVTGLGLIVPAGLTLGGKAGSINDRLLRAPVLGEWIWTVFGERILLSDSQYDEAGRDLNNRLAGDVKIQMEYKGYLSALLASYRNLPMRDRDEVFAQVAATNIPVLAIFGGADTTVLPDSADRLAAAIPNATVITLSEGEHGLAYQMSTQVNPLLISFFESPPDRPKNTP